MSKYQTHRRKWIHCERCVLHCGRMKVVLARGRVPCDVVLIGEAPGPSEDVIGRPFVGPAGKLLDRILDAALADLGSVRYAITNLVACIPREGGAAGAKWAEPPKEAIEACAPRLREFLRLANPSALVALGKLAEKHVQSLPGYAQHSTYHPAAILRMDVSQRGLATQRAINVIRGAAADIVPF